MNYTAVRLAASLLGAIVLAALPACRSYSNATPRTVHEGDHVANYQRIFDSTPQSDGVEVVHSVVITYTWRPGVVTSDDFEFEILAPATWADERIKKWNLKESSLFDIGRRKERPIRPWYAPKALADYRTYRDLSSVGYVHLLIDKEAEPDGRVRVFISKH